VKNVEVTDKNGPVVAITQVHANEELLVMTEQGKILRTPANEIRTIGRATQGVKLMDLEGEDKIVSVALVEAAVEETPVANGEEAPVPPTPDSGETE
jgi:DNA gyrase subunit A